jgi:hypothetical protein
VWQNGKQVKHISSSNNNASYADARALVYGPCLCIRHQANPYKLELSEVLLNQSDDRQKFFVKDRENDAEDLFEESVFTLKKRIAEYNKFLLSQKNRRTVMNKIMNLASYMASYIRQESKENESRMRLYNMIIEKLNQNSWHLKRFPEYHARATGTYKAMDPTGIKGYGKLDSCL